MSRRIKKQYEKMGSGQLDEELLVISNYCYSVKCYVTLLVSSFNR